MRLFKMVAMVACVTAIPDDRLSGQEPGDVAGTYEFRILSADGAAVLARGQFVLVTDTVNLDEIDAAVLSPARERSRWLLQWGEVSARACFGFEESPEYVGEREFYGGIIRSGLSTWTVENDEIRIAVYQSPDASQLLSGKITEQGLEGRVLQRDWNAASTGAPLEWLPFEAMRTSEASTEACERVLRIAGERVSR